ncbi:hypothetical protein BX600DRAFT_509047 [Xylariales sp. PMI_506]|nr:hypothetical protein BX600DRAFT_509047 [Xylariales sp. PMI_506]
MAVIFYDFEYAHDKDVEASLWQAHVIFNGEYRQIVARIGDQNQVVLKRKVDKLYRDFLKTSQFFYRGYIQRLSGRFWIPELQHAAQGLDIKPMETPQSEGAPPAALRLKLVESCYSTLVRLGDLARYRCPASNKPPKASFDIALTYYGLANMVDPDDGAAYHQTALLYQPSSQHLEIVYYFLRSICVAKPHKLGGGNLDRAYKSLLESQSSSKPKTGPRGNAPKDASDALMTWFLRLHGHYSQGAVFSAREELEKEVLHRLQLSLKNEASMPLVLKMLLINIAACDLAFDNVKQASSWSLEKSRSCQYLLTFKTRVAVVLFRSLRSAFEESLADKRSGGQVGSTNDPAELPTPAQSILPLVRIYIAWIYVSRASLAQYQDWLEPHIRELHDLLVDTFTLLLPYVLANEAVTESKYLLREDIEAVGMKPFSDRRLPLFLTTQVVPGSNPPKRRKILKPRKQALGLEADVRIENVWRIRDIICCGLYLAGSGKSPLAIMTTKHGSITWTCSETETAQHQVEEETIAWTLDKLKMSILKIPNEDDDTTDPESLGPQPPVQPIALGLKPANEPPNALPKQTGKDTGKEQQCVPRPITVKKGKTPIDQDSVVESKMIDMVNKLIDSDDEDNIRPPSNKAQMDASYGMTSSTANDIFGRFISSPGSKSSSEVVGSNSKAIPNLPWNYFYNPLASPTVRAGAFDQSQHAETTLGAAANSADYPHKKLSQGGFENLNLGTYSHLSNLQTGPKSPSFGIHDVSAEQTSASGLPDVSRGARNFEQSADQRNAALDSLRSALIAQYGPNAAKVPSPPGLAYQSPSVQPESGHRSKGSGSFKHVNLRSLLDAGSPTNQGGSIPNLETRGPPLRFSTLQTAGNNSDSRQGQLNIGLHFGQSGSERAVSAATSPLQAVFGPGAMSHGELNQQIPRSPDIFGTFLPQSGSNYAGNPSALAFSTAGSLWASTPTDHDAHHGGAAAYNKPLFNGTTTFGQPGKAINRADPPHFRDRQRNLGADESATAYDQSPLEATLADGRNSHPGQK